MHALEDPVQQRPAEFVSLHRWDGSKAETFRVVTDAGRIAEDGHGTIRNGLPAAPRIELNWPDSVSTREQSEAVVTCRRPIERHDVDSIAANDHASDGLDIRPRDLYEFVDGAPKS